MIEIVVLMQDKHTLMGLPCLKMSNGGRVIVIFKRQFFSGIHCTYTQDSSHAIFFTW